MTADLPGPFPRCTSTTSTSIRHQLRRGDLEDERDHDRQQEENACRHQQGPGPAAQEEERDEPEQRVVPEDVAGPDEQGVGDADDQEDEQDRLGREVCLVTIEELPGGCLDLRAGLGDPRGKIAPPTGETTGEGPS